MNATNKLGLCLILLIFPGVLMATSWQVISINNVRIKTEVVSTVDQQRMGLGNRNGLAIGKGMLFVYHSADERIMWMKRMRFPIDIIWIQSGKIVHVVSDIQPPSPLIKDRYLPRYGRGIKADQVLELPAGFANRHHFSIGDQIHYLNR